MELKIWKAYTNTVIENCSGPEGEHNIEYWRNNLFTWSVIYMLPLSLIALVPGIYFCFLVGAYALGVIDILTAVCILLLALLPGIHFRRRKLFFVGLFIVISCILLLYLGLSG
ncbi:MAG TPA: hypothetical protein VM843_03580, partial [Flavisolibacter sp.]|nr:hypothetical protein [Flavisolibacter sp.]